MEAVYWLFATTNQIAVVQYVYYFCLFYVYVDSF